MDKQPQHENLDALMAEVAAIGQPFTLKYNDDHREWVAYFGDNEQGYRTNSESQLESVQRAVHEYKRRQTPRRMIITVPDGCAEIPMFDKTIMPGKTAIVELAYERGAEWRVVDLYDTVAVAEHAPA